MKRLVLILILVASSSLAHAQTVVQVAESQIGRGEIGGDNRGAVVKEYTHGQEVAWCAGFVSWALSASGKRLPYFLSARAYWNTFKNNRVKAPRPGDIICYSRGKNGGHVGIVEKVEGKNITTIEGNVGRYPAVVKRLHHTLGRIPNLIGFVRI